MEEQTPTDDELLVLANQLGEILARAIDAASSSPEERANEVRESLRKAFGERVDLIPKEVLLFREVLGQESDRGCALMAAAYLESELGQLLRRYLVNDETVAGNLLTGTGGLATFSARIDLAYLLGLVSPNGRRDLHLIRKIRNDFAHSPANIAFDHPPIAARCRELHHDLWKDQLPPRKKFVRVVMGAAALVHGALLQLEHRSPSPNIDMSSAPVQQRAAEIRAILADETPA
jgi:DNA-binding MltR family transcriptional regulator